MVRLEEQVAAQDNWKLNMLRLAGEVSSGTLAELARMGPEGAPLVADLVNRSDSELDRFDEITQRRSKEATDAWGAQLTLAGPVLAAIGKTAGQGVVDELTAKLRDGTTTVAEIAAQYGVTLAGGIDPVLAALGKKQIGSAIGLLGQKAVSALTRADGGVTDYYANGGLRENHVAQIAPAGAWRVWAEEETGGEAYIPLAPGKRSRSLEIWRETGKRLGAQVEQFADGGLVALGRRFQSMGAKVTEHPAFGGVAMGGHGKTSLHYTGHAIDVNTRAGTSTLEQSELAPMAALARSLGFRTIFMAPGHFNHLHADDGGGPNMGGAVALASPVVQLAKPPSTSPFQAPISTAADAVMQHAYDEATAFLNSIGPATTTLSGGSVPASEARGGIRALGQQIAEQMGFGSQFGAIDSIFSRESGWNPNAQNPTSSAYGIPQFLNGTWAQYGGKTSDPAEQIRDGIRYMTDRYGSPSQAKAFWDRNHWYAKGGILNPHVRDVGGPLLPGFTFNGTGGPEETVLNSQRFMDAGMPTSGGAAMQEGRSVTFGPTYVQVPSNYGRDIARSIAKDQAKRERRALAGLGG